MASMALRIKVRGRFYYYQRNSIKHAVFMLFAGLIAAFLSATAYSKLPWSWHAFPLVFASIIVFSAGLAGGISRKHPYQGILYWLCQALFVSTFFGVLLTTEMGIQQLPLAYIVGVIIRVFRSGDDLFYAKPAG